MSHIGKKFSPESSGALDLTGMRPFIMGVHIKHEAEMELLEIVGTCGGASSSSGLLQGRQKHTGKYGNNGNNNEKFDQSKAHGLYPPGGG